MRLKSNGLLATGDCLSRHDQDRALAMFVNRYTGDFEPDWAKSRKKQGHLTPVQFSSDREWVDKTQFYVTANDSLDTRYKTCIEKPTWPANPELRDTPLAYQAYFAPNLRFPGWSSEHAAYKATLARPQKLDLIAEFQRIVSERAAAGLPEMTEEEADALSAKLLEDHG